MRRHALTLLVVLSGTIAFTGCLWDTTNDSSMAVQLEEVPREQLGQEDALVPAQMEPRAREIVNDGLANGTIAHGRKPLSNGTFISSNGSYYAVHVSKNGTATVERPVLEAEKVSAPNGSVSDWGNLSRSDSQTLRCAVSTRDRQDIPCVIFRGSDSAFWPELRFQYLESGDSTYYQLNTSMQTVTVDRYRYTFERIASNRSAFTAYVVRDQTMLTANLSADQREILRKAAADGIYRESPPPYSDSLRSLVDRIRAVSDGSTVYVRFNGTFYEATARQSFDD